MDPKIAQIKQLTTHYDLNSDYDLYQGAQQASTDASIERPHLSIDDQQTENSHPLWERLFEHVHAIQAIQFTIQAPKEIEPITHFLLMLFAAEQRPIQLGIEELLLNAIEHGNLGITYEEKGALLKAQQWHSELERRLTAPEYRDKKVRIHFQRHKDRDTLTIEDEGEGFDWQKHLSIDPHKLTNQHGRGIALAKSISFDQIEYMGCGNVVVATLFHSAEPTE